MRILGIDPTDPESKGGFCGFAGFDGLIPFVLGELERGRECEELVDVIARHRIEVVAVEVARRLYEDTDEPIQVRRAINAALLRQNLLAGELTRAAKVVLPGKVIQIDAPRWRSILGAKLRRGANRKPIETYDAAVARALRLRVPSWPKVSNVHERDAAGVALGAMAVVRGIATASDGARPLSLRAAGCRAGAS